MFAAAVIMAGLDGDDWVMVLIARSDHPAATDHHRHIKGRRR